MTKQTATRVVVIVMVLVALLTVGLWLYYHGDRPNMALLCAMAGGVVFLNLSVTLLFIRKNFKDKK